MEKDYQEPLKSYNPVFVPTSEEADAWAALHPDVPVKVTPAPLVNMHTDKDTLATELIESNNASVAVWEAEKAQLIADNTRSAQEATDADNRHKQELIDANNASVAAHEAHVAELLIPVVRTRIER